MKKVMITFAALIVAGLAFWFSSINRNDSLGHISITVSNELNEIVIDDSFDFTDDDTLLDILIDNYEIGCADSSYNISDTCDSMTGNIVLKINDVETDWDNNYIAIYVNDIYSVYGIESIVLHDGDVYNFSFTEVGGFN